MSPVDQLATSLNIRNEDVQRLYDAIFVAKSGDGVNIPITSSIEDFCAAIKWLNNNGYQFIHNKTISKLLTKAAGGGREWHPLDSLNIDSPLFQQRGL